MEQFNNGSRFCPCEPSCVEEVYPASVSSVTWPSNKHKVINLFKEYKAVVSHLLCQLSKSNKHKVIVNLFVQTFQETAAVTYGVDKNSVSENLIKINVFYTSLNEKTIEDVIDYSTQVNRLKDLNFK